MTTNSLAFRLFATAVAWTLLALPIAGAIMQSVSLAAPLFIGGTMKIAYDVVLYRSFRRVRPPEEERPVGSM
jgi:hypothetical protein